MSHIIELKDSNVVVVANDFNVTIMNNIWLYKNSIFTAEELQNGINLPGLVEIRTDDFVFNLIPNRLQFSVKPAFKDTKDLIMAKVGKIIENLPHTPFSAVGLNFTYHITPQDNDMYGVTKQLFCNQQASIFSDLNSEDIRFGGYFSQDFMGTRFRLDAKPVKIQTEKTAEEKIQFSYNFTVNITADDKINKILDLFNIWEDAKRHTKELTDKINLRD